MDNDMVLIPSHKQMKSRLDPVRLIIESLNYEYDPSGVRI